MFPLSPHSAPKAQSTPQRGYMSIQASAHDPYSAKPIFLPNLDGISEPTVLKTELRNCTYRTKEPVLEIIFGHLIIMLE